MKRQGARKRLCLPRELEPIVREVRPLSAAQIPLLCPLFRTPAPRQPQAPFPPCSSKALLTLELPLLPVCSCAVKRLQIFLKKRGITFRNDIGGCEAAKDSQHFPEADWSIKGWFDAAKICVNVLLKNDFKRANSSGGGAGGGLGGRAGGNVHAGGGGVGGGGGKRAAEAGAAASGAGGPSSSSQNQSLRDGFRVPEVPPLSLPPPATGTLLCSFAPWNLTPWCPVARFICGCFGPRAPRRTGSGPWSRRQRPVRDPRGARARGRCLRSTGTPRRIPRATRLPPQQTPQGSNIIISSRGSSCPGRHPSPGAPPVPRLREVPRPTGPLPNCYCSFPTPLFPVLPPSPHPFLFVKLPPLSVWAPAPSPPPLCPFSPFLACLHTCPSPSLSLPPSPPCL